MIDKDQILNQRDKLLKETCIKLASEHKKTCTGWGCDINISLLMDMLQRLGIKLTQEEVEVFA